MFGKNKNKRIELEMRPPKRRKNFFEKKKENPSNPFFSRLVFRFIFVLFLFSASYILFFSPLLKVKSVYLEGVSELNYDNIYGDIWRDLSGKYLKFVPKDNLIFVSTGKIEKDLLDKFKKISKVEAKKIFPDRIEVIIEERKALLVWCAGESCYIIDGNGYAYTNADFESDEIKQNNLLSIRDESGKNVNLGEKILDNNFIDFVTSLKNELNKETGIEITGEYRTSSRIAEEVKIKTNEGWDIYFSTSLPLNESIRTLKTFLEKEMEDKDKSKLEYIDLRAENKVYYKMRTDTDETLTDTEQTTDTENKTVDPDKKDGKKKK